MVEIPKILFLGLFEVLFVVVAVLVFLGLKLRRLNGLKPGDAENDSGDDAMEAAEAELRELRHRILELEKELEEARKAAEDGGPENIPVVLREKTAALAAAVSDLAEKGGEEEKSDELLALEKAMAELTEALGAAEGTEAPETAATEAAEPETPEAVAEEAAGDAGGAPETATEPAEPVTEVPAEEAPDAGSTEPGTAETPQDVVLLTARQILALREQRDALDEVLTGLAGTDGEAPGQVQGVRDRLSSIIEALERENDRLRQLIEAAPAAAEAVEPSEELETARKTIAELQEKIAATEEEMENLEREYDILYSKSATAEMTE